MSLRSRARMPRLVSRGRQLPPAPLSASGSGFASGGGYLQLLLAYLRTLSTAIIVPQYVIFLYASRHGEIRRFDEIPLHIPGIFGRWWGLSAIWSAKGYFLKRWAWLLSPLLPRGLQPDLLSAPVRWHGRTDYVGRLSPNPPKDTDGRREDRRRGMRELQGRWPGLDWGRWEVGGGTSVTAQAPNGRLRELGCAGWQ